MSLRKYNRSKVETFRVVEYEYMVRVWCPCSFYPVSHSTTEDPL